MLQTLNNVNSYESQSNISCNSDIVFVAEQEIEKAKVLVDSLDFSLQIKKMIEYNGLDSSYVAECMYSYKNFLILKVAYKDSDIDFVPNSLIDEAWHQHILDTQKYMLDCQLLFGEYLHHYPYFGLRGEEDIVEWKKVSSQTEKVYKHHFGIDIYNKGKEIIARGCSSQSCWSKDK